MSKFKDYFDGIGDGTNTAAECGEIRARASKIKKRRKVLSSAAGVTLAVMMTTTVAVSAAGGWDISAVIGRWFKGNAELVTENLSEVTAESAENNFEFLEITPNGAVMDDNMLIFFLDVTRNDGGVFDTAEYDMTAKDGNIFYDPEGNTVKASPRYGFYLTGLSFLIDENIDGSVFNSKYGVPARQYLVNDGNPNDNRITIAFCCDRAAIESQLDKIDKMAVGSNVIDLSGKYSYKITGIELKLNRLNIDRNNILYQDSDNYYHIDSYTSETIRGSWNGELKFDIKSAETVTVKPDKTSAFRVYTNAGEYDVHSFNVKNITLSQMSVSYELEGGVPETDSYLEQLKIGEIIMKNGDTLTVMPNSYVPAHQSEYGNDMHDKKYNAWEVSGSIMLTEPVDPDEVAAVRLGDTVFPFE